MPMPLILKMIFCRLFFVSKPEMYHLNGLNATKWALVVPKNLKVKLI